MNRRPKLLSLIAGLALGLALAPARAARADTVTSNVWLPLSGRFADFGTFEVVDTVGMVHLQAQVTPIPTGFEVDFLANLADTFGIGETSGLIYDAVGVWRGSVLHPPNPIFPPATLDAVFLLHPPNPIRPDSVVALPVMLTAIFNADGTLSIDSTAVVSGTTDLP
jgi:hypothetical protein